MTHYIGARAVALALVIGLSGPALAVRSDWSPIGAGRLRLLALPAEAGRVTAGIEIALEPGWHTYWRDPGDVGVPPRFDFAHSENVAGVSVRFPVPERYKSSDGVSLIYRDQVVLPVEVTPLDPARPVLLRLAAEVGLCRDICIPASTATEIEIPVATTPDPLSRAVLKRAAEALPGAAEPGRFAIESVTAEGEDTLLVTVQAPQSGQSQLFADPPEQWTIGQPEPIGRDGTLLQYRVAVTSGPNGASLAGQEFLFLAVAGSRAVEEVVRIP